MLSTDHMLQTRDAVNVILTALDLLRMDLDDPPDVVEIIRRNAELIVAILDTYE